MDDDTRDPVPALRAQLDQLTMSLGLIAEMFASYYHRLLDEGIPEDLAHAIALDYAQNFQVGFVE